MKPLLKPIVLFSLIFVAACRLAPVENVESASLGAPANATMEQVEEAIRRAGLGLGWQMVPEAPGDIKGTLRLRSHVAVVDITYDTKTYSINYLDSQNLKYEDGRIHKNYNSWVQNLSNAIQVEASAIDSGVS
ncbi:MAG: hypothetical protein AAF530_02575 [Pseudomonadota bacterium]